MPEPGVKGLQIVLAGGSGGLGSVTAGLLAGEGARLVVSYRANRERAERLAPIATLVEADLTRAGDCERLLDSAPELYGLAVFVGDPARTEDMMLHSHNVNYFGPLLLARQAAERMRASRTPGAIVLISTMQAVSLFPGSTVYAGAKAALLHSARILAKECRGAANIRVNVIAPGVMAAGMAEASIASGKYDRFLKDDVIHRFGAAMDVARAVRFLLEPDNYVTGQVLSVDGGITL